MACLMGVPLTKPTTIKLSISPARQRARLLCILGIWFVYEGNAPKVPAIEWIWRPMSFVPQTLRYSLRILAKSPGFTAVAVLALAFGIGANTAIYSLADILLFRPLLLPDLDRVVTVIGTDRKTRKGFDAVAPADFLDLQRST